MKELKLVIVLMLLTTTMTMCKREHKKEQQKKVEQIGVKWKEKIALTDIRTGFISDNYGWVPTVYFDTKRVSKKSKEEYIRIKTVFIDASTNKELSNRSYSLAPYHPNHKYFIFKCRKYFKNLNKSIIAKVYIEDELAKRLKVKKENFYKD